MTKVKSNCRQNKRYHNR